MSNFKFLLKVELKKAYKSHNSLGYFHSVDNYTHNSQLAPALLYSKTFIWVPLLILPFKHQVVLLNIQPWPQAQPPASPEIKASKLAPLSTPTACYLTVCTWNTPAQIPRATIDIKTNLLIIFFLNWITCQIFWRGFNIFILKNIYRKAGIFPLPQFTKSASNM